MATLRTDRRIRPATRWWMTKSPWKAYVLLLLMLISTVSTVRASGDLKNTGTINNTGQMRVRNAATGLPAVNGGVYEFFGANQSIPGRQYVDLKLTGTGTKTADADGTVSGTLTVASGVTYDTGPFTTHLTGVVNEQGYVLGKVDKSVTLSGGGGSSTIGDMGASISWLGLDPGVTLVARQTGQAQTSAATGSQSIKRFYDITPATNAGLNATLVFKYADSELNGEDAATLMLWRSPDGGATWRNQAGSVNTTQRTITKTGIASFGRWTASDAAHPLGLTTVEGTPTNFAVVTGNRQTSNVGRALPAALVVKVTDLYGSPVKDVAVNFAISGTPDGSKGQSLSVLSTKTDALGQASTALTLGNLPGGYTVSATVPAIVGSLLTFDATAIKPSPESVATSLGLTSGNNQIGVVTSMLGAPFVVTVTDQFGAPKSGAAVQFALSGTPAGATGQQLMRTLATTDSNGQASTTLKLGTRSGDYSVSAASGSLTGSPVAFTATAVAGAASLVSLPGGSSVSGQAGTTLGGPLVVLVSDSLGNPVSGVSVRFALSSSPAGATGQWPTDITVVTDNQGRASMVFTVGTKVGIYTFTVSAGTLPGQVVTVNATAATASTLAMVLGDNQSAVAGKTLSGPLVVMVTDAYGNPVSGAGVSFAITSFPAGSTGQSLSATNLTTNAQGQASTVLTLGNKAGTYSVAASSGSLAGSPVSFTATAIGGQAVASRLVQTSGSGQSGTVSTQLASSFVVTVLDQFGNPFAGATVRFAITGTPASDNAAVLSSSSVLTGTNGQASVRLTLGKTVGVYTVTASSDTLSGSPVEFTAVATGGQTGTVASRLIQTSGSGQSGAVTTQLASPFVVTVVDTAGNPVPGVSVHFALGTAPSGSSGQALGITDAATNAIGQAQTALTLGTKVGQYTVTASSGTLIGSPVTFAATALPGAAARLAMISGDKQTAPVSTVLTQPFVVQVTDNQQNPIGGAAVNFAIGSIPAGALGQTLDASQRTTDNQGLASVTLTLGDKAGDYRVDATTASISGTLVSFTGTATTSLARTLVLSSGQDQRGVVRSVLTQPFVVRTVDANNNPVSGVSVQFGIDAIPSGANGQSLSQTSVTTDQLGFGSTVLTLGDMTGAYTVRATSSGLTGSPLTLRAVATLASGAYSMVYTSGDGQSGAVLSQLASPLVATIFGVDGTPVTGQVVTFAIDSLPSGATGQVLSPTTATTDAQGRAIASLVLGNKIGTYRVSASVAGLGGSPVKYTLTSTVGAPRTLALVQGSGQTKSIGTTLDNAYVVRVLDVASNPVPGASVQFALDTIPNGSTGQSLRVVNSVTDAQGQAQAILTLGNKVGTYVVTASSAGLSGSPVRFTARATAGPAAVMALSSGDAQTAPVSTELLSPFVVTVTDVGGNAVSGSSVQFAIETTPSGSRGQALRIINSLTDAQGQASAVLMLGDQIGRYTVTASVGGVGLVRFGATATILVGDLNGDHEVNIADLTTVIDYILGKLTLTGIDSVKADFNQDGHIDIRDVVAMQNYLLTITGVSTQVVGGTGTGLPAVSSTISTASDSTGSITGEFVLTQNGIRYNLTNTIPVKGLQLIVRFRDAQSVVRPDEIFDRAKVDSFYVNSSGRELRIVAYNVGNVPIAAGTGTLFRLPVKLSDVSGIELAQMIASRPNNVAFFDDATKNSISVRLATSQDLPTMFVLYQNYPNPFNGQTKIDYEVMDVAGMADVTMQVYNVLGEKVKTLETARHAGGRFTVRWDGTDDRGTKLASGTYYYRLISGDFVSSKKMIMLK